MQQECIANASQVQSVKAPQVSQRTCCDVAASRRFQNRRFAVGDAVEIVDAVPHLMGLRGVVVETRMEDDTCEVSIASLNGTKAIVWSPQVEWLCDA